MEKAAIDQGNTAGEHNSNALATIDESDCRNELQCHMSQKHLIFF